MIFREHPILAIAYDDRVRCSFTDSLRTLNVAAVTCATFQEAEDRAVQEIFKGVLVDLTTIIRAKGEEKVVACSLVNFFPVLRVKALGATLVPMTMAGDAKQAANLVEFLNKTCVNFVPRRLREYKRREIVVPTLISSARAREVAARGFTRNISWNGMFVVDTNPETFVVGDEAIVLFPDFGFSIEVVVINIQTYGWGRPPGVGVKFKHLDETLETHLSVLLKSDKASDRDRLG
ncbi:PilZ domain-containing protein [Geobacter sp. SVR]|uniref:PilZ domain-containing protein n=1 Tax=Geobacter sp. SVR TaxID=2495594 RepID=UPI00143EFA5E|nr:PilZ domain-containing protein [Geobacter sp. SVR]BCS53521.1 hypothetical protein GSVR_18290 [Geobacter sp. SVR]GCF84282.1 pilus protein PilZ [Geobacter sp. SVR]